MKILMVLTSHDRMGDTGNPTGFWLEEFVAPYYVFKDAGAELTLASPKGGQPPIDPTSTQPDALTDETRRFEADSDAKAQLANTHKLAEVRADDYDAVFYPGGHGPLWDLTQDRHSQQLIHDFLVARKPVAAVCHAPAVLVHAQGRDGQSVVKGHRVTGFSNSEEDAVGLTDVVPLLVEDALKEKGGHYERADADFDAFQLRDGLLITGQNPASSAPTAKLLLDALTG
ncbi:type 1 glutamine amidotransferase domain-containing protein [Chromohalobacter japonicus]|uniref:type 1 glutamine amidotransferase domain-containing protein n=1 Tax=Chromohalobacter japonicus TaxID=223900 RepID=UPI001FF19A0D|nr:type 1 glutamine amidotransferase domain-containing protein [Chromohalobacter japonicus]MCK0751333.1 type 1 glutamine amidotransferase domain-containing protein [Chromohalobacter japonicus]